MLFGEADIPKLSKPLVRIAPQTKRSKRFIL